MGRRSVLLAVAIVIAALGATMVFLYVQSVDAKAEQSVESVQVLTVTTQIEPGETFADAQSAGKLDLVSVPRKNVVPGALSTDTRGVEEQTALGVVFVGQQVIPGMFGSTSSQETITIPAKTIAISVQLDDPGRVAGFVTPGSSVAIFVTTSLEPSTLAGGDTSATEDVAAEDRALGGFTRLLLPRVEVIGTGDTTVLSTTKTDAETGEETTEEIPKTILTVAVTQDQAEKIIHSFRGSATLTFGLLNDESIVEPAGPMTVDRFWTDAP